MPVTATDYSAAGELLGAPPDVRVGIARPGVAASDIATSAVPTMKIVRIERMVRRARSVRPRSSSPAHPDTSSSATRATWTPRASPSLGTARAAVAANELDEALEAFDEA